MSLLDFFEWCEATTLQRSHRRARIDLGRIKGDNASWRAGVAEKCRTWLTNEDAILIGRNDRAVEWSLNTSGPEQWANSLPSFTTLRKPNEGKSAVDANSKSSSTVASNRASKP